MTLFVVYAGVVAVVVAIVLAVLALVGVIEVDGECYPVGRGGLICVEGVIP